MGVWVSVRVDGGGGGCMLYDTDCDVSYHVSGQVSSQKCGGVGINSIDMDTFSDAEDRHDYELGQAVCSELFGDNEKCTIRAKTTTPAPQPGKDCIGRQEGTYCLPTFDGFIVCPQNVTEACPAGTVCVAKWLFFHVAVLEERLCIHVRWCDNGDVGLDT